ncbi:MAG TPA: metalloregulator ArsR/SmtB family transcription factor [Clostridia bacterium]|nr:metalloregulator ArsR/SmtB family transcription factor [Clostridia bacterium]
MNIKASGALEKASAPERLLILIKTSGQSTAAELAGSLGITGEAVRQQLLRLESEGLVTFTSEVRGRGRPVQVWKLTPAAHRRFPNSHGELATQLIEAIRKTLGEPALDRLIDARTEDLLGTYSAALKETRDLGTRLERLVALRNAEGYMAECRSEQNGFLFIENHCPICAASRACVRLCRSEQELFTRLLGPKVKVDREEHIANGARRCVYRVQPEPPQKSSRKQT